MAKKTPFFSHDMNARHDPKITAMLSVYGAEGYGIFWTLVEMMGESDGYKLGTKSKYAFDSYAKQAYCERNTIVSFIDDCINEFELFEADDQGNFWSPSLLRRMEFRDEKAKKAAESVNKRWKKYETDTNVSEEDTNVLQPQYDGYTINKTKQNVLQTLPASPPATTETEEWLEQFKALWEAYPKKAGKGDAQKWYKRYYFQDRKGNVDDVDFILGRIDAYRRYCVAADRKFKDGSTFFNQKSWEEDWEGLLQAERGEKRKHPMPEEVVLTPEREAELNAIVELQRQRNAAANANKLRTATSGINH